MLLAVKGKILASVLRHVITAAVMYCVGAGYLSEAVGGTVIEEVLGIAVAGIGLITFIANQKVQERHVKETAIASPANLTVEQVEFVAKATAPSLFAPSPGRSR